MENIVLVGNRVLYKSENNLSKSDFDIDSYIALLIEIALTVPMISVEDQA